MAAHSRGSKGFSSPENGSSAAMATDKRSPFGQYLDQQLSAAAVELHRRRRLVYQADQYRRAVCGCLHGACSIASITALNASSHGAVCVGVLRGGRIALANAWRIVRRCT
jgi:hypothetical protein